MIDTVLRDYLIVHYLLSFQRNVRKHRKEENDQV